jgi:hypothetical protein
VSVPVGLAVSMEEYISRKILEVGVNERILDGGSNTKKRNTNRSAPH